MHKNTFRDVYTEHSLNDERCGHSWSTGVAKTICACVVDEDSLSRILDKMGGNTPSTDFLLHC